MPPRAWTIGGARLLFRSSRDGNDDIYISDPDGSHQTRLTRNDARRGDRRHVSGWPPHRVWRGFDD